MDFMISVLVGLAFIGGFISIQTTAEAIYRKLVAKDNQRQDA